MVFSDTSTKLGLIQAAEVKIFGDNGYGQISGNTNRLYQFTGLLNRAQDRFNQVAFTADGRWQYDDSNNTDLPIATTNLVSGQQDYTLSVDHMYITRIEAKDSTGAWIQLTPIDQRDIQGTALDSFDSTDGLPRLYDKIGNSIFLYPAPNYNSTGGLKIYFERGPSYFVYTDTTKAAGFASIFHPFLYRFACLEYAIDKTLTKKAQDLKVLVDQDEQAIKEFFSKRNKDERPVVRPKGYSYN